MKKLVGILSFFFASISSILAQKEYIENPNPTRYLVGGSAFQLHAGEFLLKNTDILLTSLSYGFTDNLSLGVGMEILTPGLGNGNNHMPSLVYLAPKWGFSLVENLNVSIGCELVYFPQPILQDDYNSGLGLMTFGYGLLTAGTVNTNLTFGVNTLSTNHSYSLDAIFYNLAGIVRLGRSFALVAEGYLFAPNDYLLCAGWRVFGRNTSFDFGVMTSQGFPYPLPVLDAAWTF